MPIISAIEYFLPKEKVSNLDLEHAFPGRFAWQIAAKVGIETRYQAKEDETAADLAAAAAAKLFAAEVCSPEEVDYLLFCTQSPDYILPTTACLLQKRLHLRTDIGSLDFNLGCSGFVYGLGLACGLIDSGQAKTVLLLTGETYSRYLAEGDFSTRAIFSDGAAATLVRSDGEAKRIGPFVYGTDGNGGDRLIVRHHGARKDGAQHSDRLQMDGNALFQFAVARVPELVSHLLEKAGLTVADVDHFVFHQANTFILREIQRRLCIPDVKVVIEMANFGNTVSSTIPIALKAASNAGRFRSGDLVLLAGFGVGYSWAACLMRWTQLGGPVAGQSMTMHSSEG
jgi:3-oxoacyl-[acyl-carrier-protein] synthase-3